MLQLYDLNKIKIQGLKQYRDTKVEKELSGEEVLSFSYPQNLSENIKEECYIRTKENEYVIKEVSKGDDWTGFIAKVNVETIKGNPFNHFESKEQTCTNATNLALAGTGWTIGSCDVTKRRTVRKANCSSYEILQEIRKVYRCDFKFNAIEKKIYIYKSMGTDKGTYFIDQLNLKRLDVQSNSHDFCTRIIPLGKDGLDIKSINNAKEYVENYQYSNKIITKYWEDNRYTVVSSLKEDAELKLKELSTPRKAYKADIIDLARVSTKYTNILEYSLGDTITLISKDKKVKEKQRIIKLIEYPDEPEKNSCEIANRTLTLEDLQVDFIEATDTVNSVTTTDGMLDNSKIDFNPIKMEVESLIATKIDVQELNAVEIRVGNIIATKASITEVNAINANLTNLISAKANITDLTVINSKITLLETKVGSIDTILSKEIFVELATAGK
ncbi:phage tail protein, partial [Clostridium algidicarnis]|uniref:phage tail protein n=1 Tax=Clostridium algidicarnis TaxID=37659 RepID=UPI003FD8375F